MPTQKQRREERALEKTVRQAESIANRFKAQDRQHAAEELQDEGLDPYSVSPTNMP